MARLLVLATLATLLVPLGACRQAPEENIPEITPWQRPTAESISGVLTTAEPDADGVELLGVGMAEEGSMIVVNFKGPAKLIQGWNQGSVYVVDEGNKVVYDEIPVAPVIGPLFGKPKSDGQPAYAMLNNVTPGIKPGSTVTVVLGEYRRDHVTVR
jgi:hypothetical protein